MSQYNASERTYQEVAIMDRPALFTELRIDRSSVPEGVYRYELRHSDEDWGEPIELSRSIAVNFYGTVLTREPFQLPIEGWLPMEPDSLFFSGRRVSHPCGVSAEISRQRKGCYRLLQRQRSESA